MYLDLSFSMVKDNDGTDYVTVHQIGSPGLSGKMCMKCFKEHFKH